LLCDDGSEGAAQAIRDAGALLGSRPAIALYVWQSPSSSALAAAGGGMAAFPVDFLERLAAAGEESAQAAAGRARDAGFDATPLAVEAVGPVWQAILDVAQEREVSVIVVGARGVSGLQKVLLGSVSEKVVRHADRPVLVLHPTA
jgi:nucleotide-binding universal stress UspA family protein